MNDKVPLLTAENAAVLVASLELDFSVNPYMAKINSDFWIALQAIATRAAVVVPSDPTPEMIDAGAQRLVSWEDGCVWPDSWSKSDVAAARSEAEKVLRSGIHDLHSESVQMSMVERARWHEQQAAECWKKIGGAS